jgi:hypothetical protein
MIVRFRGERLLNFPREVAEYSIFELLVVQVDTYTSRDETMSRRRRRGNFPGQFFPRWPAPGGAQFEPFAPTARVSPD